jgi:predicted metal-binding protein
MTADLLNKIKELGIFQYGFLRPSDIEYRQDIRDICKKNDCKNYGKTWACPPAVGTIAECKNRCLQFNTMFVFTSKYTVKNSFDFEGWIHGMKEFKKISHGLGEIVKKYLEKYIILSNEGCGVCKICTYPNEPCRFPENLQHSIEGYGIIVSKLAEKVNIKYNNGENTVTYFGALLYNEKI